MTVPFTILESAVALHEMLTSYIKAGFTREEALHLVTATLVAATQGGAK